MSNLEERLKIVLHDMSGVEKERMTPDAKLDDDLNLDSLDRVELVQEIEEEFGIEIPDARAESMETFGDIVSYLKKHL